MAIYNVDKKISAKDFLSDKIAFPCSKKGICGKCKFKVTGDVSPLTHEEKTFLSPIEIKNNIRLACFTEILGDATVETFESEQEILGLDNNVSLKNDTLDYVCAIDIGTTTIACVIYDSKNGLMLSEVLEANDQKIYGADVISRILKCEEIGVLELSNTVKNQIDCMYKKALELANIKEVSKTVITANTTMLHILEELDPKTLGVFPFDTKSLFGYNSTFLNAYIPKCVSAYVGADLLCSTLASGMLDKKDVSLLVDIGTNGEMCMFKDEKLICCSVAAGPAFEGCGLSCGTPSIDGAITHVEKNNDNYEIKFKGADIKSICGSGIISLISAFKDLEIIDEVGRFTGENHIDLGEFDEDANKFHIKNSDAFVTQEDISKIQMAKSAICAGILTMLEKMETDIKDVSKIYISGGFGSHLNIKCACNIGLLPLELQDKVEILGNASLLGAIYLALDYEEVPNIYEEINLSSSETFKDLYVEGMFF